MKGEGGAKDKLKEILHTLKEDKESMQSIEKFSTADYGNKEEIHELLCTETKNEAISLYSELVVFNQENLKVILSEITGLGEKQKKILNEFNRRFDDLNENLERFKGEIVEEFRETELYKEGFEIITSDDYFSKYRPNKNCWDEGFRLIDVWHNYDVRREITDVVEKELEEKDVLVRGESGFGKTILFYRIIVDFVKKGYLVLYKEDGDTLDNPKLVAEKIKKYSYDKNVLVAVDNVHQEHRTVKAFYIIGNLERFKNKDKIKFFFTAKEPEFDNLLNEDIKLGGGEPELKQQVNEIKEKMKDCDLYELTIKESELFTRKYVELLAEEFISDKTILHEIIEKASSSYYEWSKGDPLLFTFHLTSEGRGLKGDVKYKINRYVEYEMDVPIEMKKDFVLLTCFLESVNVEVKHEYLKNILGLDKRTYNRIIRELKGVIYTSKDKLRTRHPRWALEYLKYIYGREKEKSFEEELIEKVEDFTDALFDLHDDTLAYNFVAGLSTLIAYNKDLRELFLPSLKVPEFLSEGIKAELFTFYVGGVYYWIHEYDKAIMACTKAIELNPELADAYLFRGAFYSGKGEFDRAIEDLNKGIDLKPNFASLAYNDRGTVYLKKEEFDKAIEDFNRAIELGPVFAAGVYRNRGIAYMDKGEFDKAIEDFNKAIDLAPEYAKAYSSRGGAYAEKGDLDRAMGDYNKAKGLNPKLAEAYNNRGVAYRKKGESDKTIQGYDTAIELEADRGCSVVAFDTKSFASFQISRSICPFFPSDFKLLDRLDNAVAYSNRGVAYTKKGELDKTIEDHNKAIELKPKEAKAYLNRGNAYGDKGELDKAIEDFNKAIELNPELADAYNNRGLTYKNKGEFDKAIEDGNKAIDLDPSFADAYNNRGLVYKEKGEFDKAIEDYNRALELNPKDDGTYYTNRGVAYDGKGEFDRAIEDYDKALELNPKLVNAYNNRGVAYKEKGEFDRAIKDYNRALELNPGYYNAYRHIIIEGMLIRIKENLTKQLKTLLKQ
jgi:tetratricopeptide (TPR) repeat protein